MGRKSKKKEEVFHVEVITQARVVPSNSNDDAKWEYYVKWATYPDSENSWEPEKNLKAGCGRLLTSFWQHVGIDNEDYQVGYVVKAKKDWIESEKAFFKAEFDKVLEKEKNEKKSKKRKRATSREVTESASTISQDKAVSKEKSPQEISSDSDDDRPLKESSSNLKIRIPKKVVLSPEPEETPPSPRPRKIQKKRSVDFNANDNVEDVHSPQHSPPHSPLHSPTSLFSDPSSPETTLSSKIPPRVRTTSLSAAKITGRITNPQARIASMPVSALTVNGGITTKQRLAKGALDPTIPKDLPAVKQPSKPLPGRGNTFMHLNFKKHTMPASVPLRNIDTSRTAPTTTPGLRSPMMNDPTLASLNSRSAESPQILSSSFSSIAKPDATSKVNVAEQHFTQPRQPSRQVDAISPTLISPSSPLLAAEDFLRGIMSSSMAGPLQPAPETIQEPMPPKPLLSKAVLPLPGRIPKIWKWTGPLHLNSMEQPMCKVKIHHLTKDNGLGFSIVFEQIEKIQVPCFYNIADFCANLGVFRSPPQLALLSPDEGKDSQPFNVLARFVEKTKKVFLMNIILDNNCIGQVLFFPYIHHLSIIGKDLPSSFNQLDSLVAAVVPYTLSPNQLIQGAIKLSNPIQPREKTNREDLQKLLLEPNLEFQHGLRVLGFSNELFLYIKDNAPGRSFCIWSERPRRKTPDIETRLLTRILEKTRAPHVAYNTEARLIFVHAGALATLYKLPRFAERRSLHNHVQFYVYGTDTDISPKAWPVQEVYPCGGIVTFTPFAMRTNPIGVLELMRKINAHPLWESYILPSALGLLAKLECGHIDPTVSQKPLMMDVILETIAEGKVSLLEAPPETPRVTKVEKIDPVTGDEIIEYKDDNLEWIKEYFAFSPPQKMTALTTGIKAFLGNKKLSNAEGSHYMAVMDEAIIADMALMQRKPVFMSKYRRYVVVDSGTHPLRQGQYVQGLEWTPLRKFDFKDDFYPKQSL